MERGEPMALRVQMARTGHQVQTDKMALLGQMARTGLRGQTDKMVRRVRMDRMAQMVEGLRMRSL